MCYPPYGSVLQVPAAVSRGNRGDSSSRGKRAAVVIVQVVLAEAVETDIFSIHQGNVSVKDAQHQALPERWCAFTFAAHVSSTL